jgi:hypothetical protein
MAPVGVDLTGGLDLSAEYGLREHPKLQFMRDSVSVWIYDDEGRFGLPRVTMEARGPGWDPKLLQVNVAFPQGRVLNGSGPVPARSTEDVAVYAGGPLEFRCVKPFERWSVSYDGTALDTTSAAQAAGTAGDAPRVRLGFELDVTMAAPPWISGEMSVEADELLERSEAIFVGGRRSFEDGMRYEQLVKAEGSLRVGDEEWAFTGSGIRVRRQGMRNLEGFAGHVWQAALFPSGRGFGYMWLLPNNYQEGYLYDSGRMLPARIVETSWLTRMVPAGEDVSFVLESELGRTEIEAESVYSVFIPEGEEFPTEGKWPLHWQQAGVRYTWDGEEAYGMMERSSSPDKVTR